MGKYKKVIPNNKFNISEDFELSDGSYSVSDIQDYFKNILKNT